MDRPAPSATFAVQLSYDPAHRFLHLVVHRCVLRTKEDVAAYFVHCYARIRTFELPADLIVRYDHFDIAGDAIREFAVSRGHWAESVGGALYRYAAANRSREMLAVSSVASRPGRTAFMIFETYEAAVAQLLADRARAPRRASYATLQRRVDNLRTTRR
jgi:hypothetical protein